MRNTVQFSFAASFVGAGADGIVGVAGAGWFVELLERIPGLEIDPELVQEDWGVVVLARRAGRRFWIGLGATDGHEWIAHVHHAPFAWVQRLASAGNAARRALVDELDRALRDGNASSVRWFDERDLALMSPAAAPSP